MLQLMIMPDLLSKPRRENDWHRWRWISIDTTDLMTFFSYIFLIIFISIVTFPKFVLVSSCNSLRWQLKITYRALHIYLSIW
jgi:hypothetical protein